MNIDNCSRCGKIYAVNFSDFCPQCMKIIEQDYDKCCQYLRENKMTDLDELAEKTEVSSQQIIRFIRQGRISLRNAPNLGYYCKFCDTIIREGELCKICHEKLEKEIEFMEANGAKKTEVHTYNIGSSHKKG